MLLTHQQIQQRVQQMANDINQDLRGEEVVFIGILNGAFMFFADLLKHINLKTKVSFVQLSSYNETSTSSWKIIFVKELDLNIEGKNVIVVDDIIDTGRTLKYFVDYLSNKKPLSIRTAVLLDKKSKREVKFEADYVWFEIPPYFVFGYGLDNIGWYDRNLSDIYIKN